MDYDEERLDEIDPDEHRNENPEAFEWTCCGKGADGEECRRGEHWPMEREMRRFWCEM